MVRTKEQNKEYMRNYRKTSHVTAVTPAVTLCDTAVAPCNTAVTLHPSREIPKWIKKHSTAKSHLIWSWVMVDIRDHHSPTNERDYSFMSYNVL